MNVGNRTNARLGSNSTVTSTLGSGDARRVPSRHQPQIIGRHSTFNISTRRKKHDSNAKRPKLSTKRQDYLSQPHHRTRNDPTAETTTDQADLAEGWVDEREDDGPFTLQALNEVTGEPVGYGIPSAAHFKLPTTEKPKPQDPMNDYLTHRQEYLDTMMVNEGCGKHATPRECPSCRDVVGMYRCRECLVKSHLCRECIVMIHRYHPLHRIEKWNGEFFEQSNLHSAGLRIYLGHDGQYLSTCHDLGSTRSMTILDTNGYHLFEVVFCSCCEDDHWKQLFRQGLYPATHRNPRTAFAVNALEHFHSLNRQGKTSAYDYYLSVLQQTDYTIVWSKKQRRLREWWRVVRQWRDLVALKRGGRGQYPNGIETTKEGELAIQCPMCPIPDVNLPSDWHNDPHRWKYALFTATDANFKCRLKDRKLNDVALSGGWSYFVEPKKYYAYLLERAQAPDEADETTGCASNFAAIQKANLVRRIGYSVSGVGAVVCARHYLVRPVGVVDLQKGERYQNMDYAVLSAAQNDDPRLPRYRSYDIACKWSVNFKRRMREMPGELQFDDSQAADHYAIPKYHIPGHETNCHTRFGFEYMLGAGRTSGEGVEPLWVPSNALAPSAQEMTFSCRQETLDDNWSDWNWMRIINMEELYATKMRNAIRERRAEQRLLDGFKMIPAATLVEWQSRIDAWYNDPSSPPTEPDPFVPPQATQTLSLVRLELAKEEAIRAASGEIAPHDISMSAFLTTGIELEHQQRVLASDIKSHPARTLKQQISLQDRRTTLQRRIQAFRRIQLAYMPFVATLVDDLDIDVENALTDGDLGSHEEVASAAPESRLLYLPSGVPERYVSYSGMERLLDCEKRLREADATECLQWIRHYRRVTVTVSVFQRFNRGYSQKQYTRSRAEYSRLSSTIKSYADRYRAARDALERIDPTGNWTRYLLILRNADISGPATPKSKSLTSDPTPSEPPSWIWSSGVSLGEDPDDNEVLRVEWSLCRARLDRLSEETVLLGEEMSRALFSFDNWSRKCRRSMDATGNTTCSPALRHGRAAHGAKQAAMWLQLRTRFLATWGSVIRRGGVGDLFRYPIKDELMDIDVEMQHLTVGTMVNQQFQLDERDGVIFIDEAEEEEDWVDADDLIGDGGVDDSIAGGNAARLIPFDEMVGDFEGNF